MTVYDAKLIAAGQFTTAGGVFRQVRSRMGWILVVLMGSGIDNHVYALTVSTATDVGGYFGERGELQPQT